MDPIGHKMAEGERKKGGADGGSAAFSALLGVALFLLYLTNLRLYFNGDTWGATLLPIAIIRGDGPYLDRFAAVLPGKTYPGEHRPWYVAESRGHIVSRYPLGPALLAVPLIFPQVMALDHFLPEWDRDGRRAIVWCSWMAKAAASAIAAATAVALFHLLRRLGLGRVALAATMAAALGSNLWMVASQGLWQHGPAALALVLSIGLLLANPMSRVRLTLAGGTTAALVAFRAIDVVFAAAIFLYVVRYQSRRLAWFLPLPILIGGTLIAYNLRYFGSLAGGQAQLEVFHSAAHSVAGPWSGNVLEGAAGTLISPSRGLFVFCPWVALALAALPGIIPRLRPWPLIRYLTWSLGPYFALLSSYSVWWGGHSFGPRFWTDAIPLFAILLGFGLHRAGVHSRLFWVASVLLITFSAAVQALGACWDSSTWDEHPVDVDHHHERLWDWTDSLLLRGLNEQLREDRPRKDIHP